MSAAPAKPRYVFVGGFAEEAPDGSFGGQLAACRSLVRSGISDHVDWILIDSTTTSIPPPPFHQRLKPAASRMARFVMAVARGDTKGALVFTSAGTSFIEKGAMVIACHRLKKRVVLSPRSGLILDDLQRSRWMRQYITYVMSCADVVMCQSTALRDHLVSITSLPPEKFQIVYNWIDTSTVALSKRAHGGRQTVFLYLGRLETYKGILDLIEAVGMERDSLFDARFIICGAGGAQEAAERRASELGISPRFDFRGWVKDEAKRTAFDESDVLVMPSHREGLPNSLLEGMASGLAVIGTRVGGIPDVVQAEVTGLLVEPRKPGALGAALRRLHESGSLRERLASAARASVLAQYHTDAIWPRVLNLLDPVRTEPAAQE
jgi:glycosyltransferase involved in cell wall biosynthesis